MADPTRIPPIMNNPEETAKIARLRDAVVDIWGDPGFDVSAVKRGPNGDLTITFAPAIDPSDETQADG